jgi:hypothetical protein
VKNRDIITDRGDIAREKVVEGRKQVFNIGDIAVKNRDIITVDNGIVGCDIYFGVGENTRTNVAAIRGDIAQEKCLDRSVKYDNTLGSRKLACSIGGRGMEKVDSKLVFSGGISSENKLDRGLVVRGDIARIKEFGRDNNCRNSVAAWKTGDKVGGSKKTGDEIDGIGDISREQVLDRCNNSSNNEGGRKMAVNKGDAGLKNDGNSIASYKTPDSLKKTEQFWIRYEKKKLDLAQEMKLSTSSSGGCKLKTRVSSVLHDKSLGLQCQAEFKVASTNATAKKLCCIDEESGSGYISSDPDRLPDLRFRNKSKNRTVMPGIKTKIDGSFVSPVRQKEGKMGYH